MRRALLTLAVLLAAPAAAAAQAPPAPTLTADTTFAFSGIAKHDFTLTAGVSLDDAGGAAIDPARGRHYAVGETAGPGGGDLAVVARRADGELDPGFAGDGTLALDLSAGGRDLAAAVVVLPDGRLRIAGASAGDAVVLGLEPDGDPDPAFGDAAGRAALLAPGSAAQRLAVAADGRIALAGADDGAALVALLDAAGSVLGSRTLTGADRAADIAWNGAGLTALVAVPGGAELRGLTPGLADDPGFSGDGALALDAGGTETAGGLEAVAGALWATGAVTVGGDPDAYLARAGADGGGLQTRRFDLRGTEHQPAEQVASAGLDLTLVSGDPDTLVVGGSVESAAGSDWGAAAFNGLDGDLAALGTGDVVLPVSGLGAATGVAGAPGVVAVAGDLVDSPVSGGGSNDSSIGMARLLVDAEKRCDLALTVVAPLELVLRGTAGAEVAVRVTNAGKRACGGTIAAAAPYTLAPALETGRLAPGATVLLRAQVGYGGALAAEGQLTLTLTAPGDVAPGDNTVRLRVAFSYCDLQLRPVAIPRTIGTEDAHRFEFTVHNAGTATCRATRLEVAGGVKRRGATGRPYTVPAGQSVSDEFAVAALRATRPNRRAAALFTAVDPAEVRAGDNGLSSDPLVVRPGDTAIRRLAARRIAGRATAARGRGVAPRTLRLARVEIAVRIGGKGCAWLGSRAGTLRRRPAAACAEPVWLRAQGRQQWSLALRRALPRGRHVVISRAVTANSVAEGRFGKRDGNRRTLRVR